MKVAMPPHHISLIYKSIKKGIVLIFFIFIGGNLPVCEAAVSLSDTVMTVTGTIEDADADAFITLAYGKKIEKIIFRDSPGGSWRAGQRIGTWLPGRGITTVVEGVCASACAAAFLGGDKRMFSPTSPRAVLAYHAPFLQTNNMTVEPLKHAWFTWIEQRTGRPIYQGFKTAINNMVNTKGAVIFRSESNPDVIANGGQTILCRGDENDLPRGCQKTDAFGAMSLGFLTN